MRFEENEESYNFLEELTPNYEHKIMKNASKDDACVLSTEEFS